uniref:Uncharacterized protein n=1 Tax=Tupiella akineta TaxID=160070 RepID=Q6UVT3_TUPAK|nr:hypothetical protein PsakpMp29 [Tupiella akineta]AAQ18741.1 hypothetical protein [Tupiella akineta]
MDSQIVRSGRLCNSPIYDFIRSFITGPFFCSKCRTKFYYLEFCSLHSQTSSYEHFSYQKSIEAKAPATFALVVALLQLRVFTRSANDRKGDSNFILSK